MRPTDGGQVVVGAKGYKPSVAGDTRPVVAEVDRAGTSNDALRGI